MFCAGCYLGVYPGEEKGVWEEDERVWEAEGWWGWGAQGYCSCWEGTDEAEVWANWEEYCHQEVGSDLGESFLLDPIYYIYIICKKGKFRTFLSKIFWLRANTNKNFIKQI